MTPNTIGSISNANSAGLGAALSSERWRSMLFLARRLWPALVLAGAVWLTTETVSGGDVVNDALDADAVALLLSRLDLERGGLEPVKAAQENPTDAARKLLAYYRARTDVKHPVDRSEREDVRGEHANQTTLDIADDAVKNILIASPQFPRHDFGEEIDWLNNRHPRRDKEWLWQLQRHYSWQHLGRAYWHTGDERYAEAYVRQLLGWIESCPLRPGSPAWRTIEAGIRGRAWTSHFQYFLDSPAVTPAVLVAFLNSCHDHAEYLTGRRFTRNNWGLMEAEGAAFIGFTFPEFREAENWRSRAIRHLNAEVNRQVRPDGHHVEQCINYHSGCIGWFTRTAELARLNGREDEFPAEFWARIEKMVAAVMKLTPPGGRSAQFGDTHSPMDCRAVLRRWTGTFDRDDFRYVGTAGEQGKPPEQTAYALKQSGFYSMRSGWDDDAIGLVLKCGPDGGWHCQPDNGTFELWAYGRRLMPDSGTYVYSGDDAGRAWFRQTRVHQTLTLDGRDIAYAPRLRLWKPGEELDTLVVENTSYEGFVHRRAVLFVRKAFFVLIDEALGDAAGNAMLHFQLAPGDAVFDEARPSVRTDFDRANLLIHGLPQPDLAVEKERGQVSFKYGTREDRPAFRYQLPKPEGVGVRFVTVLVPYEDADPPVVSVELVGDPPPGASRVELDIRVGDISERVGYDLDQD